jgi:hypothetical protein
MFSAKIQTYPDLLVESWCHFGRTIRKHVFPVPGRAVFGNGPLSLSPRTPKEGMLKVRLGNYGKIWDIWETDKKWWSTIDQSYLKMHVQSVFPVKGWDPFCFRRCSSKMFSVTRSVSTCGRDSSTWHRISGSTHHRSSGVPYSSSFSHFSHETNIRLSSESELLASIIGRVWCLRSTQKN